MDAYESQKLVEKLSRGKITVVSSVFAGTGIGRNNTIMLNSVQLLHRRYDMATAVLHELGHYKAGHLDKKFPRDAENILRFEHEAWREAIKMADEENIPFDYETMFSALKEHSDYALNGHHPYVYSRRKEEEER